LTIPRVIRWLMTLHRWTWKEVRSWLVAPNGSWRRPHADGIELFDLQTVAITRYRYRGTKIPNPWTGTSHT